MRRADPHWIPLQGVLARPAARVRDGAVAGLRFCRRDCPGDLLCGQLYRAGDAVFHHLSRADRGHDRVGGDPAGGTVELRAMLEGYWTRTLESLKARLDAENTSDGGESQSDEFGNKRPKT